jgi:hypothetical protein
MIIAHQQQAGHESNSATHRRADDGLVDGLVVHGRLPLAEVEGLGGHAPRCAVGQGHVLLLVLQTIVDGNSSSRGSASRTSCSCSSKAALVGGLLLLATLGQLRRAGQLGVHR